VKQLKAVVALGAATVVFFLTTVRAQVPASLSDELRRIFDSNEYSGETFGPATWLDDGASYCLLQRAADGTRTLVAYDTATGKSDVLADRAALTPPGASAPLAIAGYSFSEDKRRVLIFTNTRRVWRQNTRGDYWVLDRQSHTLKKLGGVAPEASLMFAKFSPDAKRVAYVLQNDVLVEDLEHQDIHPVTTGGSATIINGTSDWVNEEELGIRDAFRWSPDGRSIAFWQFDTSGVEQYTLINDTDGLYPSVVKFPYPKPGTTNSAVRVGVAPADAPGVQWMATPGDARNNYLAKMQWTSDSKALLIQQLNRLQNSNDLLTADPTTGAVRRIRRESNDSWVETVDDVVEFGGGAVTWTSEADGWRHLYRVPLDGSSAKNLTTFDGDVIDVLAVVPKESVAYVIASPSSATERFLYKVKLDGSGFERVTPAGQRGSHGYQISPDGRWAFHTASSADAPPRVELVSLRDHKVVRVLASSDALTTKVTSVMTPATEFVKVPVADGVTLDGSIVKPRTFDPSRKYPVIVYVYGEPASQTVTDRWGGQRALFHRALANQGYVIVSFDNRGTPAPKGAAWRKVVYGAVGELSAKEQAAAIQSLVATHPYLDALRVGVWGWSGGGSNTLNAMFRYPDVFKVGVSVAAVPDQKLYDTIYQERYMGIPQDNADGYRRGSPINFAEGLKGKLLIIHGSGDDNVHYQGAERLINRLVELGKPFDFMVYPNRTHGISEGGGTSLHVHSLIARYFLEHLRPGPS
jgi:dipeptidyl-peptidase-4